MRDHFPAQTHRRHDLQVEIRLPVGIADGLQRIRGGRACVVHQNVQPAEAIHRVVNHPFAIVGFGHIPGDAHHLRAGRVDDLADGCP